MTEFDVSIAKYENQLAKVISNLDNLTDENFESNFKNISTLVKQIDKTRNHLVNNFDKEILEARSDSAHMAIKQIRAKFDSIIEEKKEEQNKISIELANTANKKKLINYQR